MKRANLMQSNRIIFSIFSRREIQMWFIKNRSLKIVIFLPRSQNRRNRNEKQSFYLGRNVDVDDFCSESD